MAKFPSGPPVARHQTWIAKRSGTHGSAWKTVYLKRGLQDLECPAERSPEFEYLNLVSDVLGAGKNSRLYTRLVYKDQIATAVSSSVDAKEIGGQFNIEVTARPGEDLAKIEKAIDEELARFLAEGPTEKEMQRIKTRYVASFVRGIERIGGFGGKSDILAQNQSISAIQDITKRPYSGS